MPVGKQSIQRATRALKKEDPAGTVSKDTLPAEVSAPETSTTKKPVKKTRTVSKATAPAKPAAEKAPVKKAAVPVKKKPGRKPAAAKKTVVAKKPAAATKTYTQVSRVHCDLPTYLL